MFTDNLKLNDTMKRLIQEACGSDVACMYDFVATDDVSIGIATKKTGENFVNNSNALGKNIVENLKIISVAFDYLLGNISNTGKWVSSISNYREEDGNQINQ